ncbi:hypothetical protein ACHAXT_003691 [Thalassiosira profunda]
MSTWHELVLEAKVLLERLKLQLGDDNCHIHMRAFATLFQEFTLDTSASADDEYAQKLQAFNDQIRSLPSTDSSDSVAEGGISADDPSIAEDQDANSTESSVESSSGRVAGSESSVGYGSIDSTDSSFESSTDSIPDHGMESDASFGNGGESGSFNDEDIPRLVGALDIDAEEDEEEESIPPLSGRRSIGESQSEGGSGCEGEQRPNKKRPRSSLQLILVDGPSPRRKKAILYMIRLVLPPRLHRLISERYPELGRRLGATKIGQAGSLRAFYKKLRGLRMYISFADLSYEAIEHDYNAYDAEQSKHLVFWPWHIFGEWYDMDEQRRNQLKDMFPGCCIHTDVMAFTSGVGGFGREGPGKVYFAKYNWGEALSLIIEILLNPQMDIASRFACQQMLATKIGSAAKLEERGDKFIWAVCFAEWDVSFFDHYKMRKEEARLHKSNAAYWIGHSEWYYVYPEEEAWYTRRPVTNGFVTANLSESAWKRQRERKYLYRDDLARWIKAGLVTDDEMYHLLQNEYIIVMNNE